MDILEDLKYSKCANIKNEKAMIVSNERRYKVDTLSPLAAISLLLLCASIYFSG